MKKLLFTMILLLPILDHASLPAPDFTNNGFFFADRIEMTGTNAGTVASEIREYFEKAANESKIVNVCHSGGAQLTAGNFIIRDSDQVFPPRSVEIELSPNSKWQVMSNSSGGPSVSLAISGADANTLAAIMAAAKVPPISATTGVISYQGRNVSCTSSFRDSKIFNCNIRMSLEMNSVKSPSVSYLNTSLPMPECSALNVTPVAPGQ